MINPLSQLLLMFAGPHKLVQKRFDKLLDYDSCKERAERLKDRRVQDELQVARSNYEALNAQLLDELPKFHGAAEELLTGCVKAFAQAQKDFMRTTLGELKPLLQAVSRIWVRSVSALSAKGLRSNVLCVFVSSFLARSAPRATWWPSSKKSTAACFSFCRASASALKTCRQPPPPLPQPARPLAPARKPWRSTARKSNSKDP